MEKRDRPFARFLRELCRTKGLSSTRIEAEGARLARAGDPAARVAKTTVDDLLSGASWAPTPATIRALAAAMKLDDSERQALHDAAEEAQRARTANRNGDARAEPAEPPPPPPIVAVPATWLVESTPPSHGRARSRGVRRWTRPVIAVAALIVVVGAAALWALAATRSPSAPAARQSSGRFLTPVDGAQVTSPTGLTGVVTVPSERDVWVLIRPPDRNFYTMTTDPVPVDRDGRWTLSEVGVGRGPGDAGLAYDLYLVSEPAGGGIASAVRQLPPDRHAARFSRLPADATVLHSVSVRLATGG
jgi:hypothetical protein